MADELIHQLGAQLSKMNEKLDDMNSNLTEVRHAVMGINGVNGLQAHVTTHENRLENAEKNIVELEKQLSNYKAWAIGAVSVLGALWTFLTFLIPQIK